MYSHCSCSGAWPCLPWKFKSKKTKVIGGNFKLFYLYFATLVFSLTHNFLSSVPPEKKKENEKPF